MYTKVVEMISFVSLLVQSVFRLTAIGLITPRTVDMVSAAMAWPMKQNFFIIQYYVLDMPVYMMSFLYSASV